MHPGEFLIERILLASGICVRRAAEQLGVSAESLTQVIAGEKPVTIPHALAREFGLSRQW